jgi:hypothetical protein
MPTHQELSDLNNNCDWEWTTQNGVNGYVVCGRGEYASNSIFIPCVGYSSGALPDDSGSLYDFGSLGSYWSSVPGSGMYDSWTLVFDSSSHYTYDDPRYFGLSIRPVQGFTK